MTNEIKEEYEFKEFKLKKEIALLTRKCTKLKVDKDKYKSERERLSKEKEKL